MATYIVEIMDEHFSGVECRYKVDNKTHVTHYTFPSARHGAKLAFRGAVERMAQLDTRKGVTAQHDVNSTLNAITGMKVSGTLTFRFEHVGARTTIEVVRVS